MFSSILPLDWLRGFILERMVTTKVLSCMNKVKNRGSTEYSSRVVTSLGHEKYVYIRWNLYPCPFYYKKIHKI